MRKLKEVAPKLFMSKNDEYFPNTDERVLFIGGSLEQVRIRDMVIISGHICGFTSCTSCYYRQYITTFIKLSYSITPYPFFMLNLIFPWLTRLIFRCILFWERSNQRLWGPRKMSTCTIYLLNGD